MGSFLAQYGGDILVGLCIVAGVIGVVRSMRRDRKSGKGGCVGGCSGCVHSGQCSACHPK